MNTTIDRRRFLHAGLAGAAAILAPARMRTTFGSFEELRVAAIGVGGMGAADLKEIAGAQAVRIAALCDVDSRCLAAAGALHPTARTFADWRALLDDMDREIDAVVISTPDHMHAPIALAAMSLGKHVYCQKPIAHDLRECREMARLAAARQVITQMGTQIHGDTAYRTAVATVRAGAIGRVREAHCWVSKSWAGPKEGRPPREDEVPGSLDWNLWLGTAPERPYVEGLYHPAQWRGWTDFGCGTLGDMGCHIFDPVFSALGLGAPSRAVSFGPAHGAETFAGDGDVRYVFPGTKWTTDEFTLRWTDGRKSRPFVERAELPDGVDLPGAGSFLVGTEGVMVIPHWSMPQLYSKGWALDTPLVKVGSTNHWHEWTDACRGEGTTSTPFSYSGPLTEAVLLGVAAGRFPRRTLRWGGDRLDVGFAAGNALVAREYREGWGVARSAR